LKACNAWRRPLIHMTSALSLTKQDYTVQNMQELHCLTNALTTQINTHTRTHTHTHTHIISLWHKHFPYDSVNNKRLSVTKIHFCPESVKARGNISVVVFKCPQWIIC